MADGSPTAHASPGETKFTLLHSQGLAANGKSLVQEEECRAGAETAANSFSSPRTIRSEEHTSELQSPCNLVCRLLLEKKKNVCYRHWFCRSLPLLLSPRLRPTHCPLPRSPPASCSPYSSTRHLSTHPSATHSLLISPS